jgi:hypothetical protein
MLAFYSRNLIKSTGGSDALLPSYLLNFEPETLSKSKECVEAYKSGAYDLRKEEILINKIRASIG